MDACVYSEVERMIEWVCIPHCQKYAEIVGSGYVFHKVISHGSYESRDAHATTERHTKNYKGVKGWIGGYVLSCICRVLCTAMEMLWMVM